MRKRRRRKKHQRDGDKLPVHDETGRFYSPLVRKIAKERDLSPQELHAVPGTGSHGRVTREDLMAYLGARKQGTTPPPQPQIQEELPPSLLSNEVIEMTHMRRLIAERMIASKHTAAHVTSFSEADVTALVEWRRNHVKATHRTTQQKLTLTPLFLEAVIKAIKDYPLVNSSVDGHRIIQKKSINIGLAVALPSNDLIVPVIKNAQDLDLRGLIERVNELASRAKNQQLRPKDLEEGTFTVSNIGSFGSLMGTPIIMQPQSAILALGAVHKRPAVVETSVGDYIGIRQMMFLSHSYDHRIIDGALGGSFVKRVAEYLTKFDTTRTL